MLMFHVDCKFTSLNLIIVDTCSNNLVPRAGWASLRDCFVVDSWLAEGSVVAMSEPPEITVEDCNGVEQEAPGPERGDEGLVSCQHLLK